MLPVPSIAFGSLTPKNSEYKKVPSLPDNILFGLSEIPALIHNIRRPRSDSVGPQSAADAYETLAYREKKRRESIGTSQSQSPPTTRGVTKYENMDAKGFVAPDLGEDDDDDGDERAEAEVFMKIEKPRVRYDVEVVTKLVVYSGRLLFHTLFSVWGRYLIILQVLRGFQLRVFLSFWRWLGLGLALERSEVEVDM